ncbi:response regulator [Aromatoleum petrolei]|uniref:Response regulator n=1 Tax=Aromatoleum petrolei TaxID=76116 RepID=A0ABX1MQ00_9RHOO|nr:response regulator [Aromatoleum petrolei]NMF88199.1 response regulator [Aromatoleum petrolei]QTQ38944.1 Response regulator receiver domain-containing protein [Aromatoleum petrolei]
MATILLVEDNPANMKLAAFVLAQGGHDVLCATSADEALVLVRERQPALVLMDVQLPGMDGLTATRQLKDDPSTRAIPVIALTAFAMRGDAERIRAAGCDGYIAKPIRYQQLLGEVARALENNNENNPVGRS